MIASAVISPSAAAPSVDGVSATRSTAHKLNMSSSPSRKLTLPKFPTIFATSKSYFLPTFASTGISAAESGEVQVGDSVAVFAQGPIGLCATAGAKLKGASLIIGIESDPVRTKMAKKMGADVVLNYQEQAIFAETKRLTGGKGVDVSIEALGTQV